MEFLYAFVSVGSNYTGVGNNIRTYIDDISSIWYRDTIESILYL